MTICRAANYFKEMLRVRSASTVTGASKIQLQKPPNEEEIWYDFKLDESDAHCAQCVRTGVSGSCGAKLCTDRPYDTHVDDLSILSRVESPCEGYFCYGRNLSRIPKMPPSKKVQQGDTPKPFLFRRLGHAYEVYPLVLLAISLITGMALTGYYSCTKIEVQFDRTRGRLPPWDWERARDNYWLQGTVFFDLDNRLRTRCLLMEKIQDEMLVAAKKRGTR